MTTDNQTINNCPTHTPPFAPTGTHWVYRGVAWDNGGVCCNYYTYHESRGVSLAWHDCTPGTSSDYHYFEAVATCETANPGENVELETREASTDPKGLAGSLKAPLCLLPSFPLHEASWVLKFGAERYGPWNWRENSVCASTYRSAMQRHLDQWFDGGEDVDPETQRSHLAHVIANCCILMDAAKHGMLEDDRPQTP